MTINIKDLEKIIFSDELSAYRIEALTGISRPNISNYRNGSQNLENMTLKQALKIQELFNKMEEDKMEKTFDVIAINKTGDEYEEGSFNTLDEAKEVAEQAWDALSDYDKKNQSIEVRTEHTEDGFDIVRKMNYEIEAALKDVEQRQDEVFYIERDEDHDEDELAEAKESLSNAQQKLKELTQ